MKARLSVIALSVATIACANLATSPTQAKAAPEADGSYYIGMTEFGVALSEDLPTPSCVNRWHYVFFEANLGWYSGWSWVRVGAGYDGATHVDISEWGSFSILPFDQDLQASCQAVAPAHETRYQHVDVTPNEIYIRECPSELPYEP